jgi:hypothetical protein
MYHKQLHLLELVLETTQSGQAVWTPEDANTHRSQISGLPCRVHCKSLPTPAATEAVPDAVDVSIGGESFRFYCGSEGYDLVGQILEAAYPEVLQRAQLTAIRIDAMMNRIEGAVV